jgi:hypothetical protein
MDKVMGNAGAIPPVHDIPDTIAASRGTPGPPAVAQALCAAVPHRGRAAGPQDHDRQGERQVLDADLATLDLTPVSYLAVLNEGWDLEKLEAIELEYRVWLQCVRDFPGEAIVPSLDCDRYWHCHLLITGLYLEQTTRLFGEPLLHWPFAGAYGAEDAAQQQARFDRSRPIINGLLARVRSILSPPLTTEGD